LLNALVWEPYGLFAARFMTGIGLSSMTAIAMTYIAEIFPMRCRGKFQAWVLTVGLLGIPATAFVARYTIPIAPWGWRLVFIWGALGIVFPLLSWMLEESPRWHEHEGNSKEADAILARIEKEASAEKGPLPPPDDAVPSVWPSRSFGAVLKPGILPTTLML